MTSSVPPIEGVRRSFVEARGVRFHVTESGPLDGRPVLALHGWPQHHWVYRDLLADPPTGGQERSDRGIGTGGQERSDRGIGTGGQERSDRGIGTGGQERSDRGLG